MPFDDDPGPDWLLYVLLGLFAVITALAIYIGLSG